MTFTLGGANCQKTLSGDCVTDVYSKAKRSNIMSRVKNKRTTPEEAVAELLRQLGIRYRRNVRRLPGQPDFAIKSAKTAVFVNGCFWHGHTNCKRAGLPSTNCEFWKQKIATNKKRDRRSVSRLRKMGWRIVTVWQCRLRRPDQVRRRLARVLGRGRNPGA